MRPGWRVGPVFVAILAIVVGDVLAATAGPADGPATAELDRLVAEACHRSVVLLGEDSGHGAGHALELKTRLVERLVSECGFSAVLFESQVYDFLPLAHAYRVRRATPEQLADAIGGPWSTLRGSGSLPDLLHPRAMAGKLRLFGLSPTLDETVGAYSQRQLATDVGRLIRPPFRETCIEAIARHANRRHDDAHPSGPEVRMQLAACANAMRSGIEHAGKSRLADSEAALIAENLSRMASMIDVDEVEAANLRDRAMADNAAWALARLPKGAKAIVWTSGRHAAKSLPDVSKARVPMGAHLQRTLGERMLAIGFSAATGRVGHPGAAPQGLAPLPADALEARALGDSTLPLRYLDRAQLALMGTVVARPLDLTRLQSADWSLVFDGLVVLREERPVERPRPLGSRASRP